MFCAGNFRVSIRDVASPASARRCLRRRFACQMVADFLLSPLLGRHRVRMRLPSSDRQRERALSVLQLVACGEHGNTRLAESLVSLFDGGASLRLRHNGASGTACGDDGLSPSGRSAGRVPADAGFESPRRTELHFAQRVRQVRHPTNRSRAGNLSDDKADLLGLFVASDALFDCSHNACVAFWISGAS